MNVKPVHQNDLGHGYVVGALSGGSQVVTLEVLIISLSELWIMRMIGWAASKPYAA